MYYNTPILLTAILILLFDKISHNDFDIKKSGATSKTFLSMVDVEETGR